MNIKDIEGLKYPDEEFIKYFFKNGFTAKKDLKFIELGCGNGNNLTLPFQYNFDVIGVDIDEKSINNAYSNFKKISDTNANCSFVLNDMRNFAHNNKNLETNVLILPNIINYITQNELIKFLKTMVENKNIQKKSSIFVRCRTPKDFRYAIGEKIEHNTYRMPDDYTITGEASCLNRFYSEIELISMLKEHLNLKDYKTFYTESQNLQNENTLVFNCDIILWGTIN